MAPAKKAAAAPPKKTGIHGFSPTKSETTKIAKVTPTKPAKVKKTGFHSLRDVYAKVMAAPHKTGEVNLGEEVDEDYSPDEEDEGQDNDDDEEEAEESNGNESGEEGEGEELTEEQKRIQAKLELDPRYETNRKRALRKHRHIVARIEEDGQEWKDLSDQDLGDIIKEDKGGRFRLVEDKDGSIVKRSGGIYFDTRTNQSFQKVPKLKEKSALPYGDGEIPVKTMKVKDRAAGE